MNTISPELESALILTNLMPRCIPAEEGAGTCIAMNGVSTFFRPKGDAMMENRFDKPSLPAQLFKRALGWVVLTAQFLLKKNPDLRW